MTALIRLENVQKNYLLGKQTVPGLVSVDLEISRGDFIAVIGPSGSGKTTLLNLLSLIDEPTSGQMRFNGQLVSELSDDQLTEFRNKHVGIIFQTFNLVPVLTALENVALALQLRGENKKDSEAKAAIELERVGLKALTHHRPDELSGGQRQRVAIARALITKPDIIIADEPTAALDSATARDIIQLMRQLNEQSSMTFIFSTHDLRLLDQVRDRIELADGRLVSKTAAPANAVKRENGVEVAR